jgi:hypothetical protein
MQSKPRTVQFGRAAARKSQRGTPPTIRRTTASGDPRLWSRLSWPFSIALFAVPAALVLLTILVPRFAADPTVVITVTDRYTGQQIPGAQVVMESQSLATGNDGAATVKLSADQLPLTVRAPGYEAVETTLSRGGPTDWQVALRPTVLQGRVTDAASASGVAGADVALVAPDGSELKTVTDADGRYAFDAVPDGASLRLSSADYGTVEEEIGQRTSLDLAVQPAFVTGMVTDGSGAPIADARVAAVNGSAETTTGADGAFHLSGGTDVREVVVSAGGFADKTVAVDASRNITAALDKEEIKAIYANLGVLSDPDRWQRLIEIADTTEINAIVVDVKQDTIYYDTQVPFFRTIDGMVTPLFDPKELLAELDAHGIYAIARMVVFKDPVVAEARPDLSVKDETTGEPWLDMNGTPWVNAFKPELWQANADLAAELAQLGFDEIQYDYIRFPSDGDLRTTDFETDYTEANRRAAITGAVTLGSQEVHAAGAKFALDLFPIVALMGDDQGIGQTLQDLAPLADYVCLMIYPSHYARGNIPVDGHPNDFPSETVTYTLERSQVWAPGTMNKMRPWLQDFTYPLEGYSAYGPEQVRAQIDAAEAMGVSGWMLWNAAGEFEVDALRPG